MDPDSCDVKQKRERFKQLTQTTKVQTGKAYAADVRRSKIHPTVKKLTAWRKLNRLSQRKAVAVLGKHYFHVTFASLRSWEEGRRSPTHILPGYWKNFCPTIRP
jgi:DNA-binding transcriptional regulator YiaG